MVLVKDFYLLHFCHSLLPFYIRAPTGRKKAAAQYFVQRPFRKIKRFIMRSAYALRINSGKIIFNFAFVALCGALQTPFHRRGRKGMRHLQCLFPTETAALWDNIVFAVTALPVKMGDRKVHRLSCPPKIIFLIPARSAGRIPPAVPAQGRGS